MRKTNLDYSRFSIIIATWKRDDLLKDCIDSLLSVYGELPEIIVVDNANLDSTRNLVGEYRGTRYVAAETNLGFAGGNNLGMRYCTRDYVILLNNDTIFREDSISDLMEFMDEHPRTALAQGRAVYADNPSIVDGCGICFTSIGTVRCVGDRGVINGPYDVTRPMPAGGGPFCIFRSSALSSVGGTLYHDFFWAYFEDVDLSLRVWRSGYEFWYVSTRPVLHRKSLTGKMFPTEKILEHLYFNMAASYLICFGFYGWCKFLVVREICYLMKALALLCLAQSEYAKIHFRVICRLLDNYRMLLAMHSRLSVHCIISDWDLLLYFEKLGLGPDNRALKPLLNQF